MTLSGNFMVIKKDDGVYLQVIKNPSNPIALKAELAEMGLVLSEELQAEILAAQVMEEILITPVAEDAAGIVIEISDDKMAASLMVAANYKPADLAELEAELDKAGVMYGLDAKQLKEAYHHPGKLVYVARGTSPINGQNGRIIMHYREPVMKPVLCEDGRVNYYELGQIVPIKAGAVIAARVPATAGQEGYNVRGEVLPAQRGKEAVFSVGKGIIIVDDQAIAEFDGALSWVNNKVMVVKMLTINGDVDFSTGNIDYPGKVLIAGNVPDGFKVMAHGDIDVRGGVENATIISDKGSVFVQKGIIGRGRTFIKAYKNVEAKFIQEAQIEAGQNIVVSEYVLRSEIKAGNSILIQGRKGKIMGNNIITAKARIKASRIQNSKGLHLIVEGIQRSSYYEKIKEFNAGIEQKQKEISALVSKINNLKTRTDDPLSLAELQGLLPKYMETCEELDILTEERNSLSNILKNIRGEGMIEIEDGLEPGMKLSIKDDSIDVGESLKQFSIFYDSDEKRIVISEAKSNDKL